MTYEEIEKALTRKKVSNQIFEIRFKVRNSIKGIFIKTDDYPELSRKNLWRIVSQTHIAEYEKTRNENLARIFNGTEFTKLEAQS